MNQNVYVFIMAGGGGSRFWPLSKKVKPKQFLSITKDGESMIQMTAKRASLFTKNKVHVLTNKMYEQIVKEHLGDVALILEPVAKNTAAPIGLAACYILKQNKDAIMMIWPSDHVILNTDNFKETFDEAINLAQSRKCLVTVGIKPEYPHTGYGYIKLYEHLENNSYIVEKFVEKPNYEVAKGYVESGNYLWNSGMFVWRADVILNAIKDYMPDLYNKLMVISDAIGTQNERKVIDDYFPTLESQSIDFGVMEKAKEVCVIKANDLGWNDVGSLKEWGNNFQSDINNNVNIGNGTLLKTKNSLCVSQGPIPTFLVGMDNVIVVNTGKEVLVCNKDNAQDVKIIVEELKKQERSDLL